MQSVFLKPATQQEILKIVNSLREGTASGWDMIPTCAVMDSIDLNSSGIVPDQMKIACVIPLFKSGEQKNFSNYRPVSVLPIFSKPLERVVYNRLIDCLDEFNILYSNQYGFRKNHSTSFVETL